MLNNQIVGPGSLVAIEPFGLHEVQSAAGGLQCIDPRGKLNADSIPTELPDIPWIPSHEIDEGATRCVGATGGLALALCAGLRDSVTPEYAGLITANFSIRRGEGVTIHGDDLQHNTAGLPDLLFSGPLDTDSIYNSQQSDDYPINIPNTSLDIGCGHLVGITSRDYEGLFGITGPEALTAIQALTREAVLARELIMLTLTGNHSEKYFIKVLTDPNAQRQLTVRCVNSKGDRAFVYDETRTLQRVTTLRLKSRSFWLAHA